MIRKRTGLYILLKAGYTRKGTLCARIKLCKNGGCFHTDFADSNLQRVQICNLNPKVFS